MCRIFPNHFRLESKDGNLSRAVVKEFLTNVATVYDLIRNDYWRAADSGMANPSVARSGRSVPQWQVRDDFQQFLLRNALPLAISPTCD
jgi:hypothetical protein